MAFNDRYFLEMAIRAGKESHCVSKKVGCIAVKDNRVILTGINGTPPGFDNCDSMFEQNCTEHDDWSERHELHAEQNLITYAASHGIALRGSTIYCSHECCKTCLKLFSAIGVKRIVFDKIFKANNINREQRDYFIERNNIKIEQLSFDSALSKG